MSLIRYEPEQKILDQALASGGGEVECPDHGSAVRFRQRCNEFRKKYREHNPQSPYDRLVLPRLTGNVVKIEVATAPGTFTPKVGGKAIPGPEALTILADDDEILFDIAQSIKDRSHD